MLKRVAILLTLCALMHQMTLSAACDRSYDNACPMYNGSGPPPHHTTPSRTYNPSPPDCAPTCGAECGLSICAIAVAIAAVAGLAVWIVHNPGSAHAHAANP